MEVFTSIQSLRSFLSQQRKLNKTIGLVPTMGALHEGHISLLDASIAANDTTVCSIFVNPTQFNNSEDLAKYPRTLEADCRMLEKAGCSAVFAPSVDEMYPEKPALTVNFGSLETVMEGASRPGHFNGVSIVVGRLFNIIQPDNAYFGQKDLQQVAVIRQLITDMAFQVKLVVCPTKREASGLAMSSRNQRLDANEKALASHVYRILLAAQHKLLTGTGVEEVKLFSEQAFAAIPEFRLDYIEIVDTKTLMPVTSLKAKDSNAICVAAFLGPVRLIDNLVF
jgi:pantoate--beta-alanine ligase